MTSSHFLSTLVPLFLLALVLVLVLLPHLSLGADDEVSVASASASSSLSTTENVSSLPLTCDGASVNSNKQFVTIPRADLSTISHVIRALFAENANIHNELQRLGHMEKRAQQMVTRHTEWVAKLEALEKKYPEFSVLEDLLQNLEGIGEYTEQEIESTVQSKSLALLIMLGMILLSVVITYYMFRFMYRGIQRVFSLAQYILLFNSFGLASNMMIILFGVLIKDDALKIVYDHHQSWFRFLMTVLAIQYSIIVALEILVVLGSRIGSQIFNLRLLQLVVLIFIGMDFGDLVWFPVFSGTYPFPLSSLRYMVYVIAYTANIIIDIFIGVLHIEDAEAADSTTLPYLARNEVVDDLPKMN